MAIETILLVVEILIIVALFIVGIIIWFKTKFFTGNEAFIIVFDTKYVNGRAIGLIIDEEQVAGGRVSINYTPIDVSDDTFVKGEVCSIITKKDNILISHKSSWSKGRSIVIILPNELDAIPEIFHDRNFAPLFHKVRDIGSINMRYQSLIIQNDRIVQFANDLGNGEWSEQLMHRFKDIATNAIKLKEEAEKKKVPGYPSSGI